MLLSGLASEISTISPEVPSLRQRHQEVILRQATPLTDHEMASSLWERLSVLCRRQLTFLVETAVGQATPMRKLAKVITATFCRSIIH